ncbi:GIY-YIG nuclease family protein [Acidobacteriia bacterium AH_259_A11_L15]|nr:GIY-YIG nuclease family protein [Acidobacteriia bacterium AH_259_A11_L15]
MSESKGWFCYLLQCADGSYYVGVATDIEERLQEHNRGQGARYTRGRRPVQLLWFHPCTSYAQARALEAQLKGWSRQKKKRLVVGSLRLPLDFARGRSG